MNKPFVIARGVEWGWLFVLPLSLPSAYLSLRSHAVLGSGRLARLPGKDENAWPGGFFLLGALPTF